MKKHIVQSAVIAIAILLPSLAHAQSWSAPTTTPPGGNIASPVNTGTTAQVKNGGLSVNAFTAFSNAYFATNAAIGTTTMTAAQFLVAGVPSSSIRISGTASGGPARQSILYLTSPSNENRARGIITDGVTNVPWFFGSPYSADAFTIGRDSTQPEYPANSLFYINSSGNVGIGSTTPAAKFAVTGDGYFTSNLTAAGTTFSLPTDNSSIRFVNSGTNGTITSSGGTFSISSNAGTAGTDRLILSTAVGDIALRSVGSTKFQNSSGSSEWARITSAGNIGIGTTSPLTALAVTGQITTTGGIRFSDGTTQTSAASAGQWTTSGSDIYNNNAGNVGVGISAPVQKFQVQGALGSPASSGTTQSGITRVSNSTDNVVLDTGIRASGVGAWLQVGDKTALGTNYPLLLNPNGGYAGVGTSNLSLGYHFTVGNGTVPQTLSRIYGAYGDLYMGSTNNSSYAGQNPAALVMNYGSYPFVVGHGGAYPLILATNNAERVRIDSAGNVGIGNSSPQARLHVGNTSYTGFNTSYQFNNFGPLNLMVRDNASDSYIINNAMFTNSSTWQRLLAGGATRIGSNSDATGAIDFKVAPTGTAGSTFSWVDAMTILPSGNVGIGTTSPLAKLDISHANGLDAIRFSNQSAAVKGYLSEKSNGEIILSNNVNISDALDNSAKSAWKVSLSGNDSLDAFTLQAMTAGAGSWGSQRTVFKVNNAGTLNGPYTMSIGQSAPPTDALINAGTNNGAFSTAFHGAVVSNGGVGAILDVSNGANNTVNDIVVLNRQVNGGTAPAVGMGAALKFNVDAGSAGAHAAESAGSIASFITATNGVNNSTAMTFSTDNSGSFAERMRLNNLGYLGIGTTSPLTALAVAGQITTTGGIRFADGTQQTTASAGGGFTPGGTWRVPFSNGSSVLSDSSNFQYLIGSGSAGVARLDMNSGSRNIAIGTSVLDLAQTGTPFTGYQNTGVGYVALSALTTGASNVAMGTQALQANNTGSQNVAVGRLALYGVTSGNSNIGIGDTSAGGITTGSGNIGIGNNALYTVVNAPSNNTAVGTKAMYTVNSSNNVAIGANAMETGGAGSDGVAVGYKAMNNWGGPGNTAVGSQALYSATNGSFGYNTAVGYKAIFTANTNAYNTGIGSYALTNTTGGGDTALGYQAGSNDTGGNYNTYIGYNAGVGGGAILTNTTSIGANAKATNSNTIILGDNSVKIATGPLAGNPSAKLQISNQTSVDTELIALQDDFPAGKVRQLAWKDGTGATVGALGMTYDSATGGMDFSVNSLFYGAAYKASTSIPFIVRGATGNVGIGTRTPNATLTVGDDLGALATNSVVFGKTSAPFYQYIGQSGTRNLSTAWMYAGDPTLAYGQIQTFGKSNPLYVDGSQLYLNAQASAGNVGVGTTIPGYKLEVNGSVGAASFFYTSDKSLKKNIKTLDSALDKVTKLRGVSFDWKKDSKPSVGLIAQEVEKVYPELVSTNPQSGLKSVEYGNLVGPLIEAIKEQQKQIDTLKSEIEALKQNK